MEPEYSQDLFLLASAVAGRRVAVQVATAGDGALHAHSDGRTIVLPARDAGADERWLHVVSQALLIAAGSLVPVVLQRLIARPNAARRYAGLEVLRAATLLQDRVPTLYARRLFASAQAQTDDAAGSATLALSDQRLAELPEFIGTVRPWAVLRSAMSQGGAKTRLRRSGSGDIDSANPVHEFGEDEATEDSRALRLFSNPFGGRNPVADLLNQILGVGASRSHRTGAGGAGDGAEMPIGRIEHAWRRGVNAVLAQQPVALNEPSAAHESTTNLYPEWDGRARRYRRDWVQIDEVDPWRSDGARDLTAVLQRPSPRLKRELARLPLDFEMQRHQRDGTEFDVGRLIDHATDRRTGSGADAPAIYRASRRTRCDLGVVVVMDASGSTDERNARGESVFEHHAATAWRIARTLDQLGDRVALYGYQSWGRRRVHMLRIKGHEERWSGRIAERMAMVDAVGFTRTGAAIRHADRLLRTQFRLPHRLMVLITDGLSYDHDYEGAHAEDDTRRALAEARALGTACVCVCIAGSVPADKLVSVFGASHLLMVDDGAEVDARIGTLCARALAGVSRRRLAVPRNGPLDRVLA